jgi:hypothetical protein
MVLPVGPNHVGKDPGITWIRLGAGGDVVIAMAAGSEWVDGEDRVPTCHQAFDQQATIGFDTDDHLTCIGSMLTNQFLDVRKPCEADYNPTFAQHLPVRIDDADVMVPLTPVDANEDHAPSLLTMDRA